VGTIQQMEYMMTSFAVVLLLMMSLVTARSLSNKPDVMEKNLMVTRREVNSTDQLGVMAPNLTDIQTDLANLSIPSYLRDLYINLTYFNGTYPLNNKKVNTIRSYENQAPSKCL